MPTFKFQMSEITMTGYGVVNLISTWLFIFVYTTCKYKEHCSLGLLLYLNIQCIDKERHIKVLTSVVDAASLVYGTIFILIHTMKHKIFFGKYLMILKKI